MFKFEGDLSRLEGSFFYKKSFNIIGKTKKSSKVGKDQINLIPICVYF